MAVLCRRSRSSKSTGGRTSASNSRSPLSDRSSIPATRAALNTSAGLTAVWPARSASLNDISPVPYGTALIRPARQYWATMVKPEEDVVTDHPRFEPVRDAPEVAHRAYYGGRLVEFVFRVVDQWMRRPTERPN